MRNIAPWPPGRRARSPCHPPQQCGPVWRQVTAASRPPGFLSRADVTSPSGHVAEPPLLRTRGPGGKQASRAPSVGEDSEAAGRARRGPGGSADPRGRGQTWRELGLGSTAGTPVTLGGHGSSLRPNR